MDNNVADLEKQSIIDKFNNNVKGKEICISNQNEKHCGKKGHWLETQMGCKHNSKNEPDIGGWEMKTGGEVTTFIDKAPDVIYINGEILTSRNKTKKSAFYSQYSSRKQSEEPSIGGWKIDRHNSLGQILEVDASNNIQIVYYPEYDLRENKASVMTNTEKHVIMEWKEESIRKAIENKFNQNGFFRCKQEGNKYTKICFGKRITFEDWIKSVKDGIIYHDGYSKEKGRARHVFRANNKFWDDLITEEYS